MKYDITLATLTRCINTIFLVTSHSICAINHKLDKMEIMYVYADKGFSLSPLSIRMDLVGFTDIYLSS